MPEFHACLANLDEPGCYWFSSIIGNDEGQGLIAAIVVLVMALDAISTRLRKRRASP